MNKILKVALALTLVVVMLVVGTGTALADSDKSVSEVKGVISAIDKVGPPPTVTITPKECSAVPLKIDASTVFTNTIPGNITIDNLAINDKVTATYKKGTNVAVKITVIQPLGKCHSFEGTIKSIIDTNLVVTTKKGDETFKVSSETKYKVPAVKNATLANFKVGNKVSVSTVEVTTSGTVVQMAQRMNLIPGKPVKVVRAGTVTAYTANSSITIQDKKGVSSTFVVNTDTEIRFKKGTTGVAVGDQVTISARRYPAESQFIAKSILVFGAKQTEHGNNTEHGKNK